MGRSCESRYTRPAVVPASEPGPISRGEYGTKTTGRLPERNDTAYGPRLGGRGDGNTKDVDPVIASEAKQSILSLCFDMDCFVASAPLRKRFAFVAGNDGIRQW
jgi:hypothetical protein